MLISFTDTKHIHIKRTHANAQWKRGHVSAMLNSNGKMSVTRNENVKLVTLYTQHSCHCFGII